MFNSKNPLIYTATSKVHVLKIIENAFSSSRYIKKFFGAVAGGGLYYFGQTLTNHLNGEIQVKKIEAESNANIAAINAKADAQVKIIAAETEAKIKLHNATTTTK